jgi:glycerol kinase
VDTETTGLGAAFLAGLGTGMWSSTAELADTWRLGARFTPASVAPDPSGYRAWRRAVDRASGWVE